MRNWMRLLIFAAIVAAITVTIAPPVRTVDAGSGHPTALASVAPGDTARTAGGGTVADPAGRADAGAEAADVTDEGADAPSPH